MLTIEEQEEISSINAALLLGVAVDAEQVKFLLRLVDRLTSAPDKEAVVAENRSSMTPEQKEAYITTLDAKDIVDDVVERPHIFTAAMVAVCRYARNLESPAPETPEGEIADAGKLAKAMFGITLVPSIRAPMALVDRKQLARWFFDHEPLNHGRKFEEEPDETEAAYELADRFIADAPKYGVLASGVFGQVPMITDTDIRGCLKRASYAPAGGQSDRLVGEILALLKAGA